MKDLFLVRHAKSDWSIPGQLDFDRGLNSRGKKNAPMMAGIFLKEWSGVDMLVSSPAKRALTTASIFAEAFSIPLKAIVQKREIYEADCMALLKVLEKLPDKANRVMMFGHNPGFSLFNGYLTGEQRDLPTCAIAGIRFGCDSWSEVSAKSGTWIYFDYPKRHVSE